MIQGNFTRTQLADQTPFDNSSNGFTADIVQAAIEEITFNSSYSWRIIQTGNIVTIPYEQQMLSYQEILVMDGGELQIFGEVIITV